MRRRFFSITDRQKEFLKDVVFMTMGGYVTHVNVLVDQWFVHVVRPDFLSVHILITSLSLICATAGRVLAQASLAVAGNERSDAPLNTALTLGIGMALLSLPLLMGGRGLVLPEELANSAVSRSYYLVYCLIFAIDLVKAPLTMIMVRVGLQRRLMRLAGVGFFINASLSAGAVGAHALSEEARLLAIAGASLTATLTTLALSWVWLKRAGYAFHWNASSVAMRRLMGALSGEAVYLMALAFLPFVTLRLLEVWYGAVYVETYGVAHRLVYLLSAPYFAAMVLAVRERNGGSLRDLLAVSKPTFVCLSQIPLALGIVGAFVAWRASSISVVMAVAFIGLALRSMVTVGTRRAVLANRLNERSYITGAVEILASGLLGAALIVVLPRWLDLKSAYLTALLLPGAAYAFLLKVSQPRTQRDPSLCSG